MFIHCLLLRMRLRCAPDEYTIGVSVSNCTPLLFSVQETRSVSVYMCESVWCKVHLSWLQSFQAQLQMKAVYLIRIKGISAWNRRIFALFFLIFTEFIVILFQPFCIRTCLINTVYTTVYTKIRKRWYLQLGKARHSHNGFINLHTWIKNIMQKVTWSLTYCKSGFVNLSKYNITLCNNV